MRYTLTLFLVCISAISAQCQDCFDRGRFIDASASNNGTIRNAQGQTIDEYNATYTGCPMPAFKTVLTDSTPVSNISLSGKIVFMYFWSLHEPMNTKEVPYLNKIADSLKRKDLVYLAFCTDDPAKWDKRSEKFFHFQHIAQSKSLRAKFKYPPHVIIFGKDGNTLFYDAGLYDQEKEIKKRSASYLQVIETALSTK